MKRFAWFLSVPALAVLGACTAEESTALMEDPNGFSCRENAAARAGVDFSETSARPINTDIFGTANYDVTAGSSAFKCVIDSDGALVSLLKV